jgi:hypothetical protein
MNDGKVVSGKTSACSLTLRRKIFDETEFKLMHLEAGGMADRPGVHARSVCMQHAALQLPLSFNIPSDSFRISVALISSVLV